MGTILTVRIEEPVPRKDSVAVGVGIDASGETVRPVRVGHRLGFGDLESRDDEEVDIDAEAEVDEEVDIDAEAEGADEAEADAEAEGDADATLEADAEAEVEAEGEDEGDAETEEEADADLDICGDRLAKEVPVYFLLALELADGFRDTRGVCETTRETRDVRETCGECVEEGVNDIWASLHTIDDTSKSMPIFSIILLTLYIFTYLNLYV